MESYFFKIVGGDFTLVNKKSITLYSWVIDEDITSCMEGCGSNFM